MDAIKWPSNRETLKLLRIKEKWIILFGVVGRSLSLSLSPNTLDTVPRTRELGNSAAAACSCAGGHFHPVRLLCTGHGIEQNKRRLYT